MIELTQPENFMKQALQLAIRALDADEVPIGAIAVHQNRVIGRAHNQTRLLKDPTAHAEMIAITQAAEALQHERLLDVEIYVTIEPCAMCIGAMIHARVKRLYFGAKNAKYGACGSVVNTLRDGAWNHKIEIQDGLLADDPALLLREFLKSKRSQEEAQD